MSKEVPTEAAAAVHNALKAGEVVLVDVRERDEHEAERIEGALLLPLSKFDARSLPCDTTKEVILHCGSGKRSALAYEQCISAGVAVRAHMGGGIMAWKQAGLPTVRGPSAPAPNRH